MSCVYFFRGRGLIKIGVSANIQRRMKTVGEPVELLAWAPGDRSVEQWLHRVLAVDRVRGEWFRPSPAVLYVAKHIKRLARGRIRDEASVSWGNWSQWGHTNRRLVAKLEEVRQ